MKLLKSIGLIAGQITKLKSSVEASPTNMPRKKIFISRFGATNDSALARSELFRLSPEIKTFL
jgi:hypothetical protein